MTEKTYHQKYQEQDEICNQNIAILKPFLKRFAEQHNEGTGFYEDITILKGAGNVTYDIIEKEHPDWIQKWQKGAISIFNVKWGGLTFVTENTVIETDGKMTLQPKTTMIYKSKTEHLEEPADPVIAKAVKDLYVAQEYRSVLYACMLRNGQSLGKEEH